MKRFVMTMMTAATMAAMAGTLAQANEIHDRKVDQQKRIAQGVQNGSLTPRETARLEHNQARLNHEIRTDRKANGGNLTNNEKHQVNRQQNRLSNQIYNTKHDGPGK